MNDKIKIIDGLEGEVGVELKVDGQLLVVGDAEKWLREHTKAEGVVETEDDVNDDDDIGINSMV